MATLVYSDVDGHEHSLSLGLEPVTVGRAQECAIRSDDPRVSRLHATFFIEAGTLWVEDLGSANGVYIGANRVQRAPVLTGEYVLVGSLLIRLLSATGTMPPPNGVHGTLALWLETERRARAAVEAERDAFGRRVHELFGDAKQLREVVSAHAEEIAQLRQQLERGPQPTAAGELRTEEISVPTMNGMEPASPAASATSGEPVAAEQKVAAKARLEREVTAAQIRIQAAERNLATSQEAVAKAEIRAADLERRLAEFDKRGAKLEADLAAQCEKTAALEARLGAESPDAALQATEVRAGQLAVELADVKRQADAFRERNAELSDQLAEAEKAAKAADAREKTAQAQLSEAHHQIQTVTAANARQLKAAESRATEIETQLRAFERAEADLAAAQQMRQDAEQRVAESEQRIAETSKRANDSEGRATAADAMAKAMAKDVAEALRRAADVEMKVRSNARELEDGARRAVEAEQREAAATASVAALEARAVTGETKAAQLDVELAEVRRDLATHVQSNAEFTEQIAKLKQRAREFESGRVSAQTALQSNEAENARRVAELEDQLTAAKAAVKSAVKTAAGLEKRMDTSEAELKAANEARSSLAAELDEVRDKLAKAQTAAETARTLTDADERARQESTRAAALETELHTAYARTRELEAQVAATEQRASEAFARAHNIETRAKDAAERIVEAERRARDAQDQLAELTARLHAGDVQLAEVKDAATAEMARALAQAEARIAELTKEVDAAENVRKFSATTEREIAQLERDLREQKLAVTQLTLERDRLAAQLGDLHSDSETTHHKANSVEFAGQVDLSRYTALVARTAELENHVAQLEAINGTLKRDLTEAEEGLAAQQRARDDEPTHVAQAFSVELSEYLNILEESIDSLRANMRAASDETAVMDQTESVAAVGAAVGQAAEHVERAREALRKLSKLVPAP